MITKFGGQFIERERYDKLYGLSECRWPEACGRVQLVQSYDTFESDDKLEASLVIYPSKHDIKHHNNRRAYQKGRLA